MSYISRWGPMGFIVSPTKIVPFENFTTSVSLKKENSSDSKSNSTNVRGRELQAMTLSTKYVRVAGVDPRAKFEEWEAQVGNSNPLYIGDKRFGPAKMILTKVDLADLITNHNGDFLSMTVTITLEEDPNGTKTTTTTTKTTSTKSSSPSKSSSKTSSSSTKKQTASTYAKTVEQKKALQAAAAAEERRVKKLTVKEQRL